MSLRYLTYKEINKKKWDDCIRNSVNALIYAESIYLDHMAANWDAIVLDDYEAVMPLTWKQKWRIKYLYQPAFIQQGGIFSSKKITAKLTQEFIGLAFEKFNFAEITLNYLNNIDASKDIKITLRNNFVLQLGKGYESILKSYDPYIAQRLRRLDKFELQYRKSDDISAALKIYKKLYGERMTSVSSKDYTQFEKLCGQLLRKKRVVCRDVYDNAGNELLAKILLLKDENRIYNIISCILPNGKKLLANYFLYNEVAKEFADENILFDFEGSDIPGVAYFYEKFSTENQQYAFVKMNRLPLPVRLLKK